MMLSTADGDETQRDVMTRRVLNFLRILSQHQVTQQRQRTSGGEA